MKMIWQAVSVIRPSDAKFGPFLIYYEATLENYNSITRNREKSSLAVIRSYLFASKWGTMCSLATAHRARHNDRCSQFLSHHLTHVSKRDEWTMTAG